MNKSENIVIIPTINELAGLRKLIPRLTKMNLDVVVVDDNSSDGTKEYLTELAKKMPGRLNLISREQCDGFRGAYFAGFDFALKKNIRESL